MRFLLKTLISALIIAGASEVARKSTWMAAILVSLPLSSMLALSWLYYDTRDVAKVNELSQGILFAILPSLLFFAVLPPLTRFLRFPWAMLASAAIMAVAYGGYAAILRRFQNT